MGVKQKVIGETRYFTFYLEFPNGDVKWHQVPFIHDLMFELPNIAKRLGALGIVDHPGFERELLHKGEYQWRDFRFNKWMLRIENEAKKDNWI